MLITNAQRDPTRTAALRAEYVAACRRRFNQVKPLIKTVVVDNDALGLDTPNNRLSVFSSSLARNARIPTRYDFPSDPAGKSQAFLDWLNEMVREQVLEIIEGEAKVALNNAWQSTYVRAAYGRGIAHADALLRSPAAQKWARENNINLLIDPDLGEYSIAAMFNRPIHADLLAMLFTRNFNELKGITEAMSTQIGRALAEGMVRGLGAKAIAQMIVDRVDKIGITRAMVMARTEIIRAYAESTLNRYMEFGIQDVVGQVELSTAGDHRVCPVCKGLAGKRMTIQEARGMIPVHPQCRCAWLPVFASN